jgi:endonuclease/exonuclease/phosphatase family metal-dependent hydrolase
LLYTVRIACTKRYRVKLITWNIQWARGVDLAVDLARIARVAREMADFDVLCLQEVAVNFPGLPGSRGEDQVAVLSRALPGFSAHYGAATDVDAGNGGRSLFGNLVLSRLPVLQVYRHLLPWPADPTVKSMQRIAVEVIIDTRRGPLRVTTTHLEYYSATQRSAQVDALRALHREACDHAAAPRPAAAQGEPFAPRPRPASAILTGDFNFKPGEDDYRRLTATFENAMTPDLLDAWSIANPATPHAPTAGVYESSWATYPFCCDFIFVSADLAPRVSHVAVDDQTQASDHQPVLVEINDR